MSETTEQTGICIQCGQPMFGGEGRTFTVCTPCWPLRYPTAPAVRGAESEDAAFLREVARSAAFAPTAERLYRIADALAARFSEGTMRCPVCRGWGAVGDEFPGEPCDRCGGYGEVLARAARSSSSPSTTGGET
jgi:hypothetical protein